MQIEFYSEKDRKEYEDFILRNSNTYVFHTIEWKNVLERTYKFKSYYILVKDENERIRTILPLFFIKNLSGIRLESIARSPHGGIIGETSYIEPLIKKAIELKEELDCEYLLIKQPPNSALYDSLLQKSDLVGVNTRVNHIIVTRDKTPEVLWDGLKASNRGSIKKATKNNVIVERLNNNQNLKDIQKLELLSGKKAGLFTPGIKYYENMWEELYPKKYLDIFIAKHNGEIIAFGIFFKLHKRMVHVHVGYSLEGRNLGANNLILWTALEKSCRDGFELFDFGASALDEKGEVVEHFKGIYSYKCSFNTINQPYPWYYYPNYVQSADTISTPKFTTKFGEALVRKTPIFISKRLGTFLIKKLS